MTRANAVAKKMTDHTGVEWRPINIEGAAERYLLSACRQVYSIYSHRVLSIRKFRNCPSEYIELSHCCKRLFSIDELMIKTYPEKFTDIEKNDWKTIEIDNELSAYEVSRHGKVRRSNNHRILKPTMQSDGYLLIRMRHNGRTITEYLHRLVAKAFVPNPNGYEIVNHIDENRQNDNDWNLEWCDKSYNFKYSYNRRKVAQE